MTDEKNGKKKHKISTSSAKDKGRRLQNWVGEKVAELIGMPFGKDQPVAGREMGQCGTDVRLVGEALERAPWAIECKYQETWSIHNWIVQAASNMLKGTTWLLFVKKNRIEPIVIMDAAEFFKLLALIPGSRKGLKLEDCYVPPVKEKKAAKKKVEKPVVGQQEESIEPEELPKEEE